MNRFLIGILSGLARIMWSIFLVVIVLFLDMTFVHPSRSVPQFALAAYFGVLLAGVFTFSRIQSLILSPRPRPDAEVSPEIEDPFSVETISMRRDLPLSELLPALPDRNEGSSKNQGVDSLETAVQKGKDHILSLQTDEGCWIGEVQTDTTTESDYIWYPTLQTRPTRIG